VSIYSGGEAFFSEHRTPHAMIPQLADLIGVLKDDIGKLSSFQLLESVVAALPQVTPEPLDPQQVQAMLERNMDEASMMQVMYEEPAAIVLTVSPKGFLAAGFATAAEYSTPTVEGATLAAAKWLADSPAIGLLGEAIRNTSNMTN
jgi:hypothetical protein